MKAYSPDCRETESPTQAPCAICHGTLQYLLDASKPWSAEAYAMCPKCAPAGEHSSLNCPWQQALEVIESAAPSAPQGDTERIAQLIAHRACHSAEHDPLNGKLHGYCIVCGVPWPCEYAGTPPAALTPQGGDAVRVDDAMIERALNAPVRRHTVREIMALRDGADVTLMRAAISAALSTQEAGSPARDGDVLHAMNNALCDFGRRWSMDGDYLRCVKCGRGCVASRIGEEYRHADECKARNVETHPWRTLMEILAPIALRPTPEAGGEAGRHEWGVDPDLGPSSGYVYCPRCKVTRKAAAELEYDGCIATPAGEANVNQEKISEGFTGGEDRLKGASGEPDLRNANPIGLTPRQKEIQRQQFAAKGASGEGEADPYLRALLHYSEGFYANAIKYGMPAGQAANAVAHIESAARQLHKLAAQRGGASREGDAGLSELLTALGMAGVQVNGGTHGDPWTVKLPAAQRGGAEPDAVREGCVGEMTPERATFFLERFKREEKMLGPHEQWALDYAIAALALPVGDRAELVMNGRVVFRNMPDGATFEDYRDTLALGLLTPVDQMAFDNLLHDAQNAAPPVAHERGQEDTNG